MNRIGKLLAVGIAVALLAACQQSGGKTIATADDSDPLARALAAAAEKYKEKYTPTAPFKAKAIDLTLALTKRLLTRCIEERGEDKVKQCMHDRLLAGFDTDGIAERHCPLQAELEADSRCIMFGTLGLKIAGIVGKDEVAAFDWADPKKSAYHASFQLTLGMMRECLSTGSASDPSECMIERMTKSLELTESDIDPCNVVRDNDFQYGQCIGEAFTYKHVSDAIARM